MKHAPDAVPGSVCQVSWAVRGRRREAACRVGDCVDDFHAAAAAATNHMTDLVERWPAKTAQLLDDDRASYRYHHLVRQVLRAELHVTDRARELALQLRAAEWYEAAGDTRRAARHFLAAQEADRALALLQDRVVIDFLHDPALPAALDRRRLGYRRADGPRPCLHVAAGGVVAPRGG